MHKQTFYKHTARSWTRTHDFRVVSPSLYHSAIEPPRLGNDEEYIYTKYGEDEDRDDPIEMRKLKLCEEAEVTAVHIPEQNYRTRSAAKKNPPLFPIIKLENGRRYNLQKALNKAKQIMIVAGNQLIKCVYDQPGEPNDIWISISNTYIYRVYDPEKPKKSLEMYEFDITDECEVPETEPERDYEGEYEEPEVDETENTEETKEGEGTLQLEQIAELLKPENLKDPKHLQTLVMNMFVSQAQRDKKIEDLTQLIVNMTQEKKLSKKASKKPSTRLSADFGDNLLSSTRYPTQYKKHSMISEEKGEELPDKEKNLKDNTSKGGEDKKNPRKESSKNNNGSEKPKKYLRKYKRPPSPPDDDDPSSSESERDEEDDRHSSRTERRESRDRTPLRRNSRSDQNSLNATISMNTKSIQKLYEKSIQINKYQGPLRDKYAPLQYLKVFEDQIEGKSPSDEISGELFYDAIKKSEWCDTWSEQIERLDRYNSMREAFIEHEWDTSVQDHLYATFKETTQDNIKYNNYKDYFIYWKQRLQDLPFGEKLILVHLQDMLPMRAQARLKKKDTNSLIDFAAFVKRTDERDLQYYDSKMPNSLKKREMLFQKNKANKLGGANRNTYTKKEIPINTVGFVIGDEDKESQDF